jgi:hypothetical protein
LGQLDAARVFRVSGCAYEQYAAELTRRGQRLGDIKPAALSPVEGWSQVFTGQYVGNKRQRPRNVARTLL